VPRTKLTYDFVKNSFEEEGYVLLSSEYLNNKIQLHYKCSKDHIHNINYNNWASGYRCPYCANKLACKDNCLATKYSNLSRELHLTKNGNLNAEHILPGSKKKIWWVCSKGHEWQATPNNRTNGTSCPHCCGKSKPSFDFVKSELAREGYKLLDKVYKNSTYKLNVICSKGHKCGFNWERWVIGRRCRKCAYNRFIGKGNPNYGNGDKIKGPANPAWKGGISCEPYCDVWLDKRYKESIKIRDNYRCQNPYCFKKKGNAAKLTIHHVNYNKKDCRPRNLITICRSCNGMANKDRSWHTYWYRAMMDKK